MPVMFSIIIPTLNEEFFLPQLLRCLSKQTYQNYEVIVVDGKSKDKTTILAKKMAKTLPKITVITAKKRNVSYQRNIGASRAKGSYLVFFDADVRIEKTFLEQIAHSIDSMHYRILTTDIIPDTSDAIKLSITTFANIGRKFSIWVGKPMVGGYNIMVEKNLFNKMKGFDETVVYGEDCDFAIRCYEAGEKLVSLSHPKQIFSFRRYDREGFMKAGGENITAAIHMIMKGPIKKELFHYPMGGDVL